MSKKKYLCANIREYIIRNGSASLIGFNPTLFLKDGLLKRQNALHAKALGCEESGWRGIAARGPSLFFYQSLCICQTEERRGEDCRKSCTRNWRILRPLKVFSSSV